MKIISTFLLTTFLVILFSSCEKIESLYMKKDKTYTLDSLVISSKASNPQSCNYILKEIYRYTQQGFCDTVIRQTIYASTSCGSNYTDTIIYVKSGSIVYQKNGKNGIMQIRGNVDSEGFLVSTFNYSNYIETFSTRSIPSFQIIDTIGNGYVLQPIVNNLGNITYGVRKTFQTSTSPSSFPLQKISNTIITELNYRWDNNDMIESEIVRTYDSRNSRKTCATCPWTFSSFANRTFGGKDLPQNNLKTKDFSRFIYNDIEVPYPNYNWKLLASHLKIQEQITFSYSQNNTAYTNIGTFTNIVSQNHILENGLLKSYESLVFFNNSSIGTSTLNSTDSYKYFYHQN